jgi:hypothetical protein
MAEKMDVDELIRKEREQLMAQANSGTGDALMRGAGLAARAVGPILAGGAAGAAMGAPIAGVGAIPGFFAGATAAGLGLPLSDAAVSAYNYFAGKQQPRPSEAVQGVMSNMGLPQPETASERLASVALQSTAEAATGARAARVFADALPRTSQVARPVLETLAQQPGAQTAAAGLAGTTAQGAIEAGAPPAVALPLGIAAGVVPSLRPGNLLPNTGGPMRAENVAALEAAGIPVTPGQRTGNPVGQVVESVMKYLPTSAPTAARVEDQQMRAWTKNILGQAGINSDVATPEVLTKARQGFRTEYNNLEKTTKLQGDQQLFNDLAGIENTYVRGFNDVAPAWERMRDTVLNYATGKAGDGTDYHRLQSRISEELARAKRSDSPSAGYWSEALQGLQKSLADAMERSAPSPDLRNAWADVNRRYMVFSRIEDTMARAGGDKLNTGFIPPQQLAAVERGRNPRQWVEGGDQLTDIARAGAAVLPDPVPNSGTAQRTFVQDLLTGGKRGAPAAAAGAGAQAAGIAAIDPVISLGLPYFVARQWHAPNLTPEMRRLLGAQAVMGAGNAER